MRRKNTLYPMIITAVLLAVGLLLPFLTGQMQAFGKLLSPLHIPVFICGLTCGGAWGAVLGVILPLLRMALFGMPALPMALPMAFELCAYGLLTGTLYPPALRRMKAPRYPAMLGTLVIAMVAGRIVGGAAKALLIAGGIIGGMPLTFEAFIAAYFADTLVGAGIHLLIVPAIVIALEKAKLSPLMYT